MKLASLILGAALLGGCAIAGAGAGIMGGVPTNAQGGQPSAAPSTGPATAGNKGAANKAVDKVLVSADTQRVEVKKSVKVQATVSYLDGSKDNDIQWSSADATIVTVNATTGEISGVKEGTATIYAKAASDPTKFVVVNVTVAKGVTEDLFVEIKAPRKSIAIKETVKLTAAVTDSNTETSPNGSWETSNKAVAAVSSAGIVTGLKAGKVTITFTSDLNPEVNASVTITVTDPDAEEAAAQ